MIFINTPKGRYTCVRHNHNHRMSNGLCEPCMACKPAPRRMNEKDKK